MIKYIQGSVESLLKLNKAAKAKYGDEVYGVRVKKFNSEKVNGIVTLKDGTKHQMTVK